MMRSDMLFRVLIGCCCLLVVAPPLRAQEKTKVPALLKLLRPLKGGPQKAEQNAMNGRAAARADAAAAADFEIVDAVNVDPFQQQFSRQFRGLLKAELFFLNRTCGTTPEQRARMKVAATEVLKDVVKKFVEIQKKMNQGGFDWNSPTPEPRRFLQDGLANEAKRILPPEQVALYENELVRRLETRKRASIANVVARMDDELILTAEQRVKLTEELTSKWKAAETQQMEIFLYGEQYFPNIPEQFVMSVLNAKQKDVWRGMTRNGTINFGIGHIGNVTIDENAWGDDLKEDPKDAANEAAARKVREDQARARAAKAEAAKEIAAKEAAAKEAAAKEAAANEAVKKKPSAVKTEQVKEKN